MSNPKPKKNNYFDADTEKAIIQYNLETDPIKKNKIYQEKINYAFNKLAENLIHSYKFYKYDSNYSDFKHEIVTHFIEKLNMFDSTKGKAFSYFTRMGINFCIINNTANYKNLVNKVDVTSDDVESKNPELILPESIVETEVDSELSKFVDSFIIFCERNVDSIFSKPKDLGIAHALLDIFRRREDLENFDKKFLYMCVREITNCTTQEITKVVNTLKKMYKHRYNKYLEFQ